MPVKHAYHSLGFRNRCSLAPRWHHHAISSNCPTIGLLDHLERNHDTDILASPLKTHCPCLTLQRIHGAHRCNALCICKVATRASVFWVASRELGSTCTPELDEFDPISQQRQWQTLRLSRRLSNAGHSRVHPISIAEGLQFQQSAFLGKVFRLGQACRIGVEGLSAMAAAWNR